MIKQLFTRLGRYRVIHDRLDNEPYLERYYVFLKDRERFLDAYKEMTRKDLVRMNLTEPLRTMRMVHFNAWITKRWEDHSFQRMFPQFPTANYWDQQLIDLRVQVGLIQDRSGMGFV